MTRIFITKQESKKTVSVDASLEEDHTSDLDITSNPVELGAEINDHAIIKPKQLKMRVAVTDTPLGFAAFQEAVTNLKNLDGRNAPSRSEQGFLDVVSFQESRVLLSVQTELKLYKNMMIEKLKVFQDSKTAKVAEMVVDFKELIIVSDSEKTLKKTNLKEGKTQEQAEETEKSGRKNLVTPSSQNETSYLKAGFDWLFGGIK